MLNSMKKRNSEIPNNVLPVFEDIIQKYETLNTPSLGMECDNEFSDAMEQYLTQAQRYWLYEQNGGCKGTGDDKERQAFALKYAQLPLVERLELFNKTFGRKAVLNDDNTITVTFRCKHGYYKKANEGKISSLPPRIQPYFERCAGGRLYELQKVLGIKLRIKTVDISPLNENIKNPVVFIFEIVE